MNIRTSDGVELYIEKSGDGIPCIYLHGGPGYWSKSFAHFSREILEEDMEMVYLDQRGCGRSGHDPNENYSLDRLIEDIEEVRKQLHIKEWYVMGHSFGGILAVNYAYQYPDRTKGIILANATLNLINSFRHQMDTGTKILKIDDVEIPTNDLPAFIQLFYSILGKLQNKEQYEKYQFSNLENKKKLDQLDEDEELNTDPSFQKSIFSSNEFFQDFTLLSEEIMLPVLVLTGTQDDAVGPDHYQTFKFNNSNTIVLESAHHPYIENQIEFRNAVLEFIHK